MKVMSKSEVNMKYYKRESGTIVKIDDNMKIFYLNKKKEWINDQTLIDMFLDDLDYEEISEEEVRNIIGENYINE